MKTTRRRTRATTFAALAVCICGAAILLMGTVHPVTDRPSVRERELYWQESSDSEMPPLMRLWGRTLWPGLRYSFLATVRASWAIVVALLLYHWGVFPFWVRGVLPRCRFCGYILKGIPEPRCPECGGAV